MVSPGKVELRKWTRDTTAQVHVRWWAGVKTLSAGRNDNMEAAEPVLVPI